MKAEFYAARPWANTIGYCGCDASCGTTRKHRVVDVEVWVAYFTSESGKRLFLNGGTLPSDAGAGPAYSRVGHALYSPEQAAVLALLLGCNVLRIA